VKRDTAGKNLRGTEPNEQRKVRTRIAAHSRQSWANRFRFVYQIALLVTSSSCVTKLLFNYYRKIAISYFAV